MDKGGVTPEELRKGAWPSLPLRTGQSRDTINIPTLPLSSSSPTIYSKISRSTNLHLYRIQPWIPNCYERLFANGRHLRTPTNGDIFFRHLGQWETCCALAPSLAETQIECRGRFLTRFEYILIDFWQIQNLRPWFSASYIARNSFAATEVREGNLPEWSLVWIGRKRSFVRKSALFQNLIVRTF